MKAVIAATLIMGLCTPHPIAEECQELQEAAEYICNSNVEQIGGYPSDVACLQAWEYVKQCMQWEGGCE